MKQALNGVWNTGRHTVGAIAAEVSANGAVTRGVEPARSVHDALQLALEEAGKGCSGLAAQERALAQELAALQAPLQAAG